MTVFAVISISLKPELEEAVKTAYPDNYLRLNELTWLVSDSVSTPEVCAKLNIVKGGTNSTVVLPTGGSYFGLASVDVWEWLKSKWEGSNGR